MRLKVAAVLLVILAIATPGFALSINELDVNASLMVIGSTSSYGDVSPVVQLFGVSLPLHVSGPFYLEPMLEFFGTDYEWTPDATAVPAQIEAAAGFWTLGTLISMHGGVRFALTPKVSLGGSVGLDFLLRFPLEFFNDAQASVDGRGPALNYFFAKGRFFYPETRVSVIWQVSEPIGLIFNLRAFYPVFHLWDGMGQPFIDQFMFSGGIGIAIRLGPASAASAPTAPATPAAPAPEAPGPEAPAPAAPAPEAPGPEAPK
jgi:hypothetical protein